MQIPPNPDWPGWKIIQRVKKSEKTQKNGRGMITFCFYALRPGFLKKTN